jgi:transcriptional regulator GlxA family with amidase domain
MSKVEAALMLCSPTPAQANASDVADRRPNPQQSEDEANPGRPSHLLRGGLAPWRLRRTLDYVEQNLSDEIRLQHLADAARLSPHHFSDLFRQSTGVSPYRYVLERRVARAKCLLRDSLMGVLDIALAVGFSDQSHFSKVFRRATGMTPGGFRNVMWAEGVSPSLAFPEDRTNRRTNVLTMERKDR